MEKTLGVRNSDPSLHQEGRWNTANQDAIASTCRSAVHQMLHGQLDVDT